MSNIKEFIELAKQKGFSSYVDELAETRPYLDYITLFLIQKWLKEEHRILCHELPRTSGKHVWGIWRWNDKETLWEEITGRWDNQETCLLKALNLLT